MSRYTKTLSLLDKLIAKLQANTGGEVLLPQERLAPIQAKPCTLVKDEVIKVEAKEPPKKEVEKKEAPKKKKAEAGKQPGKNQPEKPKIPEGGDPDVLVFCEADLRISEIVDCWIHPESTYLYCEKILVGKDLREIASGLQQHVKIEDMKGKVIVMANLKPKPVGGFVSNGMVICSSDKEHKQFEILRPEGELGERLYLDGYEELFACGEEILPILKKKPLEKCLEHFATDAEGFVVWKGIKLRSKAGYIRSSILNGGVD